MSQEFRELIGTDLIKNDRETINKNFWDLRSCSAGTAAPTNNLVVGMTFFNTNTKKLYRLMSDLTTWTLEADFSSGVVVVPQAGSATDADKAVNDANGKALTDYVAKLEQSQDNAFVINVYDGNNKVINTITIPETKIDVMQGATSTANGREGLVPAPSAGDENKALCGDGSYKQPILKINGSAADDNGDVSIDTLPAGTIIAYAGNTVPAGYLNCGGAAISRTTYAKLFAAIGTTWGAGDGSTTFNLPNLNNNSFLEGSNTAGTVKSAGLPNATGEVKLEGANDAGYWGGATGSYSALDSYGYRESYQLAEKTTGKHGLHHTIALNLSLSNSLFGASNTVQPKSVTVKYCIKY